MYRGYWLRRRFCPLRSEGGWLAQQPALARELFGKDRLSSLLQYPFRRYLEIKPHSYHHSTRRAEIHVMRVDILALSYTSYKIMFLPDHMHTKHQVGTIWSNFAQLGRICTASPCKVLLGLSEFNLAEIISQPQQLQGDAFVSLRDRGRSRCNLLRWNATFAQRNGFDAINQTSIAYSNVGNRQVWVRTDNIFAS